MAATMKDIARRTGLGLATISSYFNGGNVREKNRIKIEEAIEEPVSYTHLVYKRQELVLQAVAKLVQPPVVD